MHRTLAAAIALTLLLAANLAAQVCLGSTASSGQVGLAGQWAQESSADAYGLHAQANFPGRSSAGLGYAYSQHSRDTFEYGAHVIESRAAYEFSAAKLSICPAVGVGYEDGRASVTVGSEPTELATHHASWRTLTAPTTLNIGLRISGPAGIVLIPSASAGGMLWRFRGENTAWRVDGELRDSASGVAWLGSAGLTVGSGRLFATGRALESTLPHTERELRLSVGWLTR